MNCLVPRDPDIRILAQNRNYSQSVYELDYVQTGVRQEALASSWWPGNRAGLGAVALLLFTLRMLMAKALPSRERSRRR